MTYRYNDSAPTHSNAYLWPVVIDIMESRGLAGRLFELGCGNGATSRMLAARGYDVTAVDPSESGIAQARAAMNGRAIRFEIGSTPNDLAGRFGAFPLVLSLEVIEHVPSTAEYMRTFAALLTPNGIGIISTPYHGWLKNVAIAVSGRFDSHVDPLWEGGHLKFFSEKTLRKALDNAGLRCIEMRRVGRIPALAKSMLAVVARV